MGIFNFLSPTPASHAKGICRAMKLSFFVKLEEAKKRGEKNITFGELSKRALSVRPGWQQINDFTFKSTRSGKTINVDIEHDNLADVIKKVLKIEIPEFLTNKKKLTEDEIALAIDSAIKTVDEYFKIT